MTDFFLGSAEVVGVSKRGSLLLNQIYLFYNPFIRITQTLAVS